MEIKIVEERKDTRPIIADLEYGTLVRYEDNHYIKVSKKTGVNINFEWTVGFCILLNIRYGTLRQVKEQTIIDVLHSTKVAEVFVVKDEKTLGRHLKQ